MMSDLRRKKPYKIIKGDAENRWKCELVTQLFCFLQGFDIADWLIKITSTLQEPATIIPKVFIQNNWRLKQLRVNWLT